jgi:serpin B
MGRRRFLWLGGALALAGAAGCGNGSKSGQDASATVTHDEVATRLASGVGRTIPGDRGQAMTALSIVGADILRAVHHPEANTALSPYSLFAVLAMARAGAKAATADQLDAVLRLVGPQAQGAALAAIDEELANERHSADLTKRPIVIQAANEAWVQRDLGVRQEYVDQLTRQFGVSVVTADFAAYPEQVRSTINRWVSERTNALIPELFEAGSIDEGTLLALVNAMYFTAPWQNPFEPAVQGTFTTSAGDAVQVPMMRAPDLQYGASGPGWQAVSIPYIASGIRMTVLMPDSASFASVLTELGPNLMVAAGQGERAYILTMPRFAINARPDVKDALQVLGLTDLFIPGTADLSGIAGEPGGLSAAVLLHQVVVRVDEYGTEAAAATGATLAGGVPPVPTVLVIDRPFLFWISTWSGAPLFLGVVNNPVS